MNTPALQIPRVTSGASPRPAWAGFLAIALLLATAPGTHAQVPQLINYQGRVAVGSTNFDGSGQFKFALVNGTGITTYWSNDGTSTAGSEPAAAVSLTVTKGLYVVLLGDATLPNMTIVPATVFTNPDVRLRVWFSDGPHGFQLLTPDQRIAAVGYALMAGTVPVGRNPTVFQRLPSPGPSLDFAPFYGVRRQSAAATALWLGSRIAARPTQKTQECYTFVTDRNLDNHSVLPGLLRMLRFQPPACPCLAASGHKTSSQESVDTPAVSLLEMLL